MSISLRSLLSQRSILLQVAAVLVLCQVLAHVATFGFMIWRYERPDLLAATSISTIQALGFRDVVLRAGPEERPILEAAIERAHAHILFRDLASLAQAPSGFKLPNMILDGLRRARPDLATSVSLVAIAGEKDAPEQALQERIALDIGNGRALVFDPDHEARRINVPRVIGAIFVIIFVVPLVLLPIWAALLLTAPLRRLAQSAERFSIDLDPTPLPEEGSAEIGRLASSFNLMRARIRLLVDSRSRMLAAVSHDLRTPLTRLRLKTEALGDSEDKDKMLRDIATMNTMIGQALSYLRDQTTTATRERVDLPALLGSICDDFADAGQPATFSGPRNVVLECEPDSLTRAISNLIDNAVKFGGHATVRLAMRSPAEALVVIEDEGPGIPDDRKFFAFEPFSRGDQARGAPETEGFGLGLAIAKQIIERHGGQITLHDRKPRGLTVQVLLPISAGHGAPLAATHRALRQTVAAIGAR